MHFSRWKISVIAAVCLAGVLTALPNFLSKETLAWVPDFLPKKQLNLGLDLRGGAHLLLQMDTKELKKDWLDNLRGEVRKILRDAKIRYTGLGQTADAVRVKLVDPAQTNEALSQLRKLAQPVGGGMIAGADNDIAVSESGDGFITVAPTEAGIHQRSTNAAAAAIEVVRRRIDAIGTTEPDIVRQGTDRILVQVPGFDDTKKLKDLIGQTARLSFHDVHQQMSAEEARQTRVPPGYVIYPDQDDPNHEYLVQETPVVYGEDLTDAQPGFDSRTNEPIITFRFNQRAARIFGEYSSRHVGRPFAIVLDNGVINGKRDVKVLSAPVIREPILGGTGQISGSFTVDQANNLAIQLRSGALPATLSVIEERTVGPSLGADSIEAGILAGIIGSIAVSGFIIFAYGLFGLFAILAVAINLCLIVGLMSTIGSTLTLPGIAGLVLTVGMAVDSNVLIYERIREEMRNGKQPISAIDSGFQRALGTIVDSNLTTMIAGLVMFWLGAGPVRGFAVTLCLGILATMFTAFTVTRLMVSLWIASQKTRKIPAPL
ncbi:Protein translocase subunit SecD [Candidatus Filomicrobium marinum]|uniref:Protein translocase subunit SecD n=2 Tax=Filomicrobium TaxID=119044 RepID=A0A0D6JGQ5_9HYPH|nr:MULTISPECIES: protein translocase subunit SecD [Filomicrobium]MCV0369699.1 protein translocase subunit SecD [Filomicrobium sp.]CFX48148.1 Protein translocase subunit SecD [Candidatus Filomicrobium marinum]CPR20458.1 Protein translocase subunit SecD [Candidatus Filomicrobium marinum]SDP15328.1 preprotein translocase subunit SecD [Filomicrobium insigne]